MEKKRLYRSKDEKIFLGVLGGIAKYLDVDPTLVRIIYVILLFLAPVTAILMYFALALIMPEEPEEEISLDKLPEKAEKIAKEIDETLTQAFSSKKPAPTVKDHSNEKLLAIILIILGGVLILRKIAPFMWYLQGDVLLAVLLLLFGIYLLIRG
ncbi:PspC domain-containing protein [Thermococcus sp. SY098]|uniref:PspC domain-containing protein n=1 Tax=Thermococcus sp. SY098 TaxID=3111325 RepID=UPI002D7A27CE|nr:PspC domain-containing protein [Thermococcus sp. SY098]WRS53126.1 PspC domain-containing protein [Thermococcus sp. SY098]